MGGFSALLNIFNTPILRPFSRMFYIDAFNKRKKSQKEVSLRIVMSGNF